MPEHNLENFWALIWCAADLTLGSIWKILLCVSALCWPVHQSNLSNLLNLLYAEALIRDTKGKNREPFRKSSSFMNMRVCSSNPQKKICSWLFVIIINCGSCFFFFFCSQRWQLRPKLCLFSFKENGTEWKFFPLSFRLSILAVKNLSRGLSTYWKRWGTAVCGNLNPRDLSLLSQSDCKPLLIQIWFANFITIY